MCRPSHSLEDKYLSNKIVHNLPNIQSVLSTYNFYIILYSLCLYKKQLGTKVRPESMWSKNTVFVDILIGWWLASL